MIREGASRVILRSAPEGDGDYCVFGQDRLDFESLCKGPLLNAIDSDCSFTRYNRKGVGLWIR